MRIRSALIAGLALCSLQSLALAQETPDDSSGNAADVQQVPPQPAGMSAEPQSQAGLNDHSPSNSFWEGDVLKIIAYGRDDLTGEHMVQSGRLLSLPLIGTVELANLNPRQLEDQLAKAWENRLGAPMSVNIEFSQRAPVYVMGDVGNPGAYPYRGGMTVMQAVAVSGGLEKFGRADPRLRMDVMREHEKREEALEKMAQALATRARLIAERDGKPTLSLDQPVDFIAPERMDKLLADQAVLLDVNNKQNALKEAALTDQIKLGEDEVAALQSQIETLTTQQQATDKEVARMRRVPGQQNRVFDLEQRSTTLSANKVGVLGNISNAKKDVETARNGIASLRESRQQEIASALMQAETMYEEGRLSAKASTQMLVDVGYGENDPAYEYKVVHRDEPQEQAVEANAEIRPGDVVTVKIVPQPQARPKDGEPAADASASALPPPPPSKPEP